MYIKNSSSRRKIVIAFGLMMLTAIFFLSATAIAQTEKAIAAPADPAALKWGLMAAAMSVGVGCIGAGIAVAYVGSAAVAAVAEKPQLAGRTLIFVGLAEGIAIYGLIVAIMILAKV